MELSINL